MMNLIATGFALALGYAAFELAAVFVLGTLGFVAELVRPAPKRTRNPFDAHRSNR
jgi:hypothetical protein